MAQSTVASTSSLKLVAKPRNCNTKCGTSAVTITSLRGHYTKGTNKLHLHDIIMPAFGPDSAADTHRTILANDKKSKNDASIVTSSDDLACSHNVAYVDANAQRWFAFIGAIKGSPFTVRIRDAESHTNTQKCLDYLVPRDEAPCSKVKGR